jgi:hypothetical protein
LRVGAIFVDAGYLFQVEATFSSVRSAAALRSSSIRRTSGDEDLREAVLHAQGFGVSVVLAGLPATARQGQSELLIREADHHVVLDSARIGRHLRLGPLAAPAGVEQGLAFSEVVDQTNSVVLRLAQEVVNDPRFAGRADLLDADHDGRLTRQADRLLVSRLADLTGVFPVQSAVLRSARAICVVVAAERWPATD